MLKKDQKKDIKSSKSKTDGFVMAKGTLPIIQTTTYNKKCKFEESTNPDVLPLGCKKTKVFNHLTDHGEDPVGLVWDEENYSCAYDTLFTILRSIWAQKPSLWKQRFKDMNRTMNMLATGFY